MTHPVGLVDYGDTLHAWVLDLPGCIAGARSEGELAPTLDLAIAEHCGWLRRHGEDIAIDTAWRIAERVDGCAYDGVGGEFCFRAEQGAMSRDELDRGIARMGYARAGLGAAIGGLPGAVLDWAPPRSAFGAFDAWAPEVRTIRDVARHVLELEAYYRGGLADGPAAGIFGAVGGMDDERRITVDALRALDDDARARVYRPVRPGRSVAEEWTVRKALRRMISHERAHTAEIVQRCTWILLGAPDRGG